MPITSTQQHGTEYVIVSFYDLQINHRSHIKSLILHCAFFSCRYLISRTLLFRFSFLFKKKMLFEIFALWFSH